MNAEYDEANVSDAEWDWQEVDVDLGSEDPSRLADVLTGSGTDRNDVSDDEKEHEAHGVSDGIEQYGQRVSEVQCTSMVSTPLSHDDVRGQQAVIVENFRKGMQILLGSDRDRYEGAVDCLKSNVFLQFLTTSNSPERVAKGAVMSVVSHFAKGSEFEVAYWRRVLQESNIVGSSLAQAVREALAPSKRPAGEAIDQPATKRSRQSSQ